MYACATLKCPNVIAKAGKCDTHKREAEKARGSRQQRGYGAEHDALRKQWAPRVATGRVACWRCRELIKPTETWDLGHDDNDRTKYRGPEHLRCNRSAGGKLAHSQDPSKGG